eukprot:gene6976-biopygen4452
MNKSLALPSTAPLAAFVAGSELSRGLAVLIGSAALALSAQMTVPMYPVPMTMQTFAVIMIGALCGARLATEIVIAYLLEGAVGLPVFAGGATGIASIIGNTGGYLVGFLPAAALIGWFADRGWNANNFKLALSLSLGHLIIFVPGVAWLAGFVGLSAAFTFGFVPFILGTVLKTALAFFALRGVKSIMASRLFGHND